MKVAVIGTGHVGLVTGVCLAGMGHSVACVDISREVVERLKHGEASFYEPGLTERIQESLRNGRFWATVDLKEAMAESQLSIIAVNTPSKRGDIDTRFLMAAVKQVGQALRSTKGYHVVVIKSTVPPGTTGKLVRRELEQASGLEVGNFGLCMNPEFLREGSAVSDFVEPDRIVIGEWDGRSGQVLDKLYSDFDCPRFHTSLENAELIKYASNALLATLISFSNEIASLCEEIPGCDVERVADGLHLDRRLSPVVNGLRISPGILSYLRAGAGFGGSCLPKDVNALRAFARKEGVRTPLLDAVMKVNQNRSRQIVRLLEQVVGSLAGRIVTVLGLTFKPGTDDLRESPAIRIVQHLIRKRARVRAYDPLGVESAKTLVGKNVSIYDTPESALTGADAALIATAWPEFSQWNWHFLTSKMRRPIIFDGRNALGQIQLPANILYQSIGSVQKR